ncbi:MAG: winged helix-turn-helix transcriptional regulator [Nitrososphaerales archaeon]
MEITAVDMKDVLLQHVRKNPGIRYRELLRLTSLSNGVLTYHLAILEKSGKIQVRRKNRKTSYYPLDVSAKEADIIACLKADTARQIILFMLDHDLCTFNEIVEHTGRAPSTVSWNLARLRDAGIMKVRYGEYSLYELTDRQAVTEILSRYKGNFLDRIVNNYTEMINEL